MMNSHLHSSLWSSVNLSSQWRPFVQWFAISAGDNFLLDVDPRNVEGTVEPGTLEARDAGVQTTPW
jgi:hypothetical protein